MYERNVDNFRYNTLHISITECESNSLKYSSLIYTNLGQRISLETVLIERRKNKIFLSLIIWVLIQDFTVAIQGSYKMQVGRKKGLPENWKYLLFGGSGRKYETNTLQEWSWEISVYIGCVFFCHRPYDCQIFFSYNWKMPTNIYVTHNTKLHVNMCRGSRNIAHWRTYWSLMGLLSII
jgi:hypothetical protein